METTKIKAVRKEYPELKGKLLHHAAWEYSIQNNLVRLWEQAGHYTASEAEAKKHKLNRVW